MSEQLMKAPRAPRWIAGTMLGLAGGAMLVAVLVGDEALADPPGWSVTPVVPDEPSEPWTSPGEIDRLSLPFTPQEQGIEPTQLPEVPVDAPTYIFVNMDGTNLTWTGGDNSTQDSSVIAYQYNFDGPYPAYGGTAAQRQSVMDAVEADWAPFNMIVTSTRPVGNNYTMCMTGPANQPFGNNVLGIAPLDCQNANPNNIVFAFHSANQLGGGLGANTQATTISQEVAHAYGVEHVTATSDIMNPYNAGGNPSFTNNCIAIDDNGMGIVCGAQHQQFCAAGQQNSYMELMEMFGASDPDNTPPSVSVTYPSDGATFGTGDDFVITCAANDNQGVASVALWINGDNMGTKAAAPYEWDVVNIPAGDYDIYCIALDEWDNQAMSAVVSIGVADGGGTGESGGSTSTTSGDTGADTGGDTSGDTGAGTSDGSADEVGDEGGLPPGFGLDDDDSGCACTSDGRVSPSLWLLGLLGLPLLRRRR
ncbi:Ig-like domain-containing protein [Nannocystaceae bacterium ST9]